MKHADIGTYLSKRLNSYAKERGIEINVKYIDPTYAIRGVPANSADIILCTNLAQNAVHGVISGFTGFSIGVVRGVYVYIPINMLIKAGKRKVNTMGRMY